MGVPTLTVLFVIFFVFTNGQQNNYSSEDDYTYMSSTETFYKYHSFSMTWNQAKEKCELEGAVLFYANDQNEATEVLKFWNQKNATFDKNIFVGIYCETDDKCTTVDGHPSHAVYIKWGPEEPRVKLSDQSPEYHCARMDDNPFHREGGGDYYTSDCDNPSHFICKKALEDHQSGQESQFSKGFQTRGYNLMLYLAVVLVLVF